MYIYAFGMEPVDSVSFVTNCQMEPVDSVSFVTNCQMEPVDSVSFVTNCQLEKLQKFVSVDHRNDFIVLRACRELTTGPGPTT